MYNLIKILIFRNSFPFVNTVYKYILKLKILKKGSRIQEMKTLNKIILVHLNVKLQPFSIFSFFLNLFPLFQLYHQMQFVDKYVKEGKQNSGNEKRLQNYIVWHLNVKLQHCTRFSFFEIYFPFFN